MSADDKKKYARYIKGEKLRDLRTKREIELMNGRPWTRELPPPPVLPPFGPLEKISGRLESFGCEYFKEYFDVKAYRTSTLPDISDGQRGATAAVAIAAGSPGVGAAIMAGSDSAYDTAGYVQGEINGRPFRGWVGRTRLQASDEVEMVVEWQHDHYEVYAIALPEERIVSIIPKCDMGHIAHALWRIKNMFILTAILLFMFMFMFMFMLRVFFHDGDYAKYWFNYHGPIYVMLAGSLGISGLIAYFAYKACTPTRCKLAEEIFHLLGMRNVANLNLNKITKEREQQLMDKGKWHDPDDQSQPVCPTQKFVYSAESWFYY
ncbi:putative type VI secretion system effector [Pantoea sp. S-LA4]